MRFKDFNFHPKINIGIDACGYINPTPIQEKAIPPILDGQDIFGLAQTGTGKTAAFVLPILQKLLDRPRKKEQVLIMAPTRELAEQTHENIVKLAKKTGLKSVAIYGGIKKQSQIRIIRSKVQIIVACPGRLLDLVNDKVIRLNAIEMLVIDEADQMFDMGFLPDIRRIIQQLPKNRQSLMFSATMPRQIRLLAEKMLQQPVTVQVNHSVPAPTISHARYSIAKEQRTLLLKHLLHEHEMKSALVFTRTKHKAKSLARQLENAGYSATSLQGNLSQQKRKIAMDGFRDGKFKILVATDIAARGIDVLGISHVINYDMPDTVETYTHRTGRTGRATQTGQAFTFFSQADKKMISMIEKNLGKKMSCNPSPPFEPAAKSHARKHKNKNFSHPARRKKKIAKANHGKQPCLWSESLTQALA
ncbi:MAG: DEAD/DEAH box helicase [Desulfobacteraceae bacterium]|nr:DEAD/DEAH box helicase [Desulfobacteraceae bacterium]